MRSLAIGLLVIMLAAPGFAQDQEVRAAVDWESGVLTVTVQRTVQATGPNQAAVFSEVAADVERNSSQIVVDELRRLQYDSTGTLEDLLVRNPNTIHALTAAAAEVSVIDSHATTNLRAVEITMQLELRTSLMPRLVSHDRHVPLRGSIGWTATADYTGVVIYAADRLTVHGTGETAYLEPALFPGIYFRTEDGDGVERLMEAAFVSPEFIRRWGPVYYTNDPVSASLVERVGENPLTIIAYGAFGESPTDVVISRSDAAELLATAGNRSLIAEGRVAIILNPGRMQP